jgi:hypothetical protein
MRFTIRDLLWLTVVVALALGWWIHQRGKLLEREQLRRDGWAAKRLADKWKIRAETMADFIKSAGYAIEMDENTLSLGIPPKYSAPAPNPPSD